MAQFTAKFRDKKSLDDSPDDVLIVVIPKELIEAYKYKAGEFGVFDFARISHRE